MNRNEESQLLDFCVDQKNNFTREKWSSIPGCSQNDLAAATLFLSSVEWYGHRDDLLSISQKLKPYSEGHLSELVKSTGFNCSRFSNMLKARIKHARV